MTVYVNYCYKLCCYLRSYSISLPDWLSQDQNPSSSRESWALLFSKSSKSMENNQMPWISFLKTDFQGIVCGLRGSLPHGSLHLHLISWWSKTGTWGVLRTSVAKRKAVFPEISYPLAGLSFVQKCPVLEFSSFPPSVSRFQNHSFHLSFVCSTKHLSYLESSWCTARLAALLQAQHILRNKSDR